MSKISDTISKVSPRLTVIAVAIFIVFGLLRTFTPIFSFELTEIHYLIVIASAVVLLLQFVIKRFDNLETKINILKKNISDIQNDHLAIIDVFNSPEELYTRLLELSKDSKSIATTTTQALPKHFNTAGKIYFETIHSYIKNQKIENFRRLVIYESEKKEKAEWLFKIINKLKDCNNFSLGYIDMEELKNPITHFHLIHRKDGFYTFVINTPPHAGEANAFLVRSKEIYDISMKHYNSQWSHAVKLKNGVSLNFKDLHKLSSEYHLEECSDYKELIKKTD